MSDELTIREAVRDRYARAALQAERAERASCGGSGGCGCDGGADADIVSRDLYDATELAGVPGAAALASLGCGNPTALAELLPGEVVLDLGSGGGIDVLLSARRVGPTGKAYGLDMTDEMLALARANQREMGVENAEFLKGMIEDVPLPDDSVDVVISNCVINLSTDKDRVLREAFRVLKPGGRLAVADIVVLGSLPESVRRSMEAWSGCIAGALHRDDYIAKLTAAGFAEATVEVVRAFTLEEAAGLDGSDATLSDAAAASRSLCSAFVRAQKPV